MRLLNFFVFFILFKLAKCQWSDETDTATAKPGLITPGEANPNPNATTSKSIETIPKTNATIPKSNEVTPKIRLTTPERSEGTLKPGLNTPTPGEANTITLKSSETTPMPNTTTLKPIEATSENSVPTPKSNEVTPKIIQTTLKFSETTTKLNAITPKSVETTPMPNATIPAAIETTPKTSKTTPKSEVTPKIGQTTSKFSETTAKPNATIPTFIETTPKTSITTPKSSIATANPDLYSSTPGKATPKPSASKPKLNFDNAKRNFARNNRKAAEIEKTCEKIAKLKDRLAQKANRTIVQTSSASAAADNSTKNSNYKDAPNISKLNAALANCLYNGDVVLTSKQADALEASQNASDTKSRKKRGAGFYEDYPKYVWTNNVVPYFMNSTLASSTKTLIQQAIAFWESQTCITFQQASKATGVNFFAGDGCYSYVGMIYIDQGMTSQDISIGSGCEHLAIIAHEIGHALGLFHEQSRYDRDSYVSINMANLADQTNVGDFEKETPAINNNFGVNYDYGSVMHYADTDFAKSGTKMITAKDPYAQRSMGSRVFPSYSDVYVINQLYKCTAATALSCQNSGYPNPSSGAVGTCICPWGFGGALCDQRQASYGGYAACGSTITATANWQTLSGSVSVSGLTTTFNACVWWIQSPTAAGTIQIQILSTSGICAAGCFFGFTEIKLKNFTNTGYRYCGCSGDVSSSTIFNSTTSLAMVNTYSRENTQSFSIKYRSVGDVTGEVAGVIVNVATTAKATTPTPTATTKPATTAATTKAATTKPATTRPTTKATTTPKPCTNLNADCSSYVKKGYCSTSSVYSTWMSQNCQKSCAINKNTTVNCNYWADKGYCSTSNTYYTFMSTNCKSTCGFC